ncbi:pteridine reductase [Pseudoxanthomonas taiwanensis]|jgi:Dehydrogenases with different specificities (related to short-chain alcohol dehydrogenases)|uniref:Pteridine reductase n=1 Tax=Pseudoxanthomonas taiwanensis TaxID=176598 RepID=A0A921NXK2_9GAMM|nr:pteridine reductase [Pseudoxanthomonas taiwanensis]KAF1690254.1 pteridine reductase [Pseudoxanthomonas taiwanensis]MBO2466608.1 pteridine reductase [Xanthomonadaceae bacterium]
MTSPHPVALVTGAARRIGAAIARRLHAAGYDLALHHRRSDAEMAALAAQLRAARPDSVLVLRADLRQPDGLPDLVARCVGHYGRLDALVNNASSFHPTPLGRATPEDWDDLFGVNARAPFFLAQAAAPHLQAAGGAIVNLADVYAGRPLAGHPLYSAAKAALVSLTRSLALALAPRVRVNAVAPGAILWPEQEQDPAARAAILAATALGRTGTPEDIAGAVHWLLSDEAGYVTGQVLHVDGGRER